MKVYLLGPMTGYFDDNRPLFRKWTAFLRLYGFNVVSPDELDTVDPTDGSWEGNLARDLKYVVQCHSGFALPGWRQSPGATLEATVLTQLKRQVWELPAEVPTDGTLPETVLAEAPSIVHPSVP